MGKILGGALVLLAAGTAASAAAQADAPWTAEQQEIVDVAMRTAAANNAGDVEAWVSLFATDAVYMPPGVPPVTTREGPIEVARTGFRHAADIKIRPVEIEVVGSWAFAWNLVSGTVTVNPTGEVVQVDSKQLVVYRRGTTGMWEIARMITNSDGS